ncbi:NADH-quinone oxidoreductase subunit H [uncultured Rikenella sp.]|uniref:respiratory chain complex I subunit 1 family protein n=1 Tax=uncultured Rikenella sp. TaxID=368003 RepID=UPI00260C2C90|nr:NADH-quinone oxidoreductase subunit H [uncultured Rikenella sp.]
MFIIPLFLILVSAVCIKGVINKTRARLAGRKGVRFFQPLLTVGVLLQKGEIYSTSATWLTRTAPALYLATTLGAVLLLPLGIFPAAVSFYGDFILFAYLLGFGKLALVLAALESGSSFQGMGSAREVLFSMLVEPCFFLLVGTLAMVTGYGSFSSIFATFDNVSMDWLMLSLVMGYAFLNVALVENGRLPVDDPRTHLELTMVHEAMVLDLSGVDLAFIQVAGWLKLSIWGALLVNVVVPGQVEGWMLAGWFLVAMAGYGVLVGAVESLMARNRMTKNATYLATVSAIGLLGFGVAYVLMTSGLS